MYRCWSRELPVSMAKIPLLSPMSKVFLVTLVAALLASKEKEMRILPSLISSFSLLIQDVPDKARSRHNT